MSKPTLVTESGVSSQTMKIPTGIAESQTFSTRKAIVRLMSGEAKAATIKQIERAVGKASPMAVRDSVEAEVQSMVQEGLIERSTDSRRLQLTERGKRLAVGLDVLDTR